MEDLVCKFSPWYSLDTNQAATPAVVETSTITAGNAFRPTNAITIPEINTQNGQITSTVWVVVPATATEGTVMATLTPGPLEITNLPTPDEGQPATIWTVPGGPKPTDQVTVTETTTLPGLPRPVRGTVIPGPPPPPGGTQTHWLVPGIGDQYEPASTCVCATENVPPKVVITQPGPAPTLEIPTGDGNFSTIPASKFPCSSDDKNPCRGAQQQAWRTFSVVWTADYPRPGAPKPFTTTSNFDTDTILTLTDDEYQAEHFTVTLDGEKIGETHEKGWKNNKLYCGKVAEDCMSKGFSHGHFLIPKGQHDLGFQWTDGPYQTEEGWNWWYGAGQYRFDKPCSCAEA